MWILIMWVATTAPMTSIPFNTKEACEIARADMTLQLDRRRLLVSGGCYASKETER
jgi:hypothetical protein